MTARGVFLYLLLGLSSCAVSEAEFGRLASEATARDNARYQAAVNGLRARGYTLIQNEHVYFATLDPAARQRCIDHQYGRTKEEGEPYDPEEMVPVLVSGGSKPGEPGERVDTTAPSAKVCEFFSERTNELVVERADGTSGTLMRGGGEQLARSDAGQVVVVETQVSIVKRHTVLVDRTCNEMPRVLPSPIEMETPLMVFWGPRKKRGTVKMVVEREELDIECTNVVH